MLHPNESDIAGGVFGTLPTTCQSFPRSELYALLVLLTMTEGSILVFSDYLPVVRSFQKPPEH
eukprot:488263-Pyramimonas_sp.AAC.1